MKIYDNVILNTELEELAVKGIHKGCIGIILDKKADICFVCFANTKNKGDYACLNTNQKYLDYWMKEPEENITNWERFKSRKKLKTEFKINPFKEFDWVEILVEKEEYTKEGLHKGMFANVAFDNAIDDMLGVIFPVDDGRDREVYVHLDDIKLCD